MICNHGVVACTLPEQNAVSEPQISGNRTQDLWRLKKCGMHVTNGSFSYTYFVFVAAASYVSPLAVIILILNQTSRNHCKNRENYGGYEDKGFLEQFE